MLRGLTCYNLKTSPLDFITNNGSNELKKAYNEASKIMKTILKNYLKARGSKADPINHFIVWATANNCQIYTQIDFARLSVWVNYYLKKMRKK